MLSKILYIRPQRTVILENQETLSSMIAPGYYLEIVSGGSSVKGSTDRTNRLPELRRQNCIPEDKGS